MITLMPERVSVCGPGRPALMEALHNAGTTDGVGVSTWPPRFRSWRLPLYLLDGNGLLQLVVASLPEHEQPEFAEELPKTNSGKIRRAELRRPSD
jgi:acyl-CoA synthetase (AMP-forming)/AMP-acid ligase II